jgi:hypothetical protein
MAVWGLGVACTLQHPNGQVRAGEDVGGVRPSSGAASNKQDGMPDSATSPSLSNIAAPGDGRTPLTSLPPSPKMTRKLAEARAVGSVGAAKFDGTAFLGSLKRC